MFRIRRIGPAALCLLLVGEASAQQGFYVGTALGTVIPPTVVLTASDNDWGTRCDLLINPQALETGSECATQPPPTEWSNTSGAGPGVAAGFAAGYRRGRLRIEAEYLFRSASYHDYSPTRIGDVVTQGKADQELEFALGGVGDATAHAAFANVLYDVAPGARLSPIVGAGAGAVSMSLDYFSLWKRNADPARIATFTDPLLQAKLAGTTTLASAVLHDTMSAFQWLAGLDWRPVDNVSLGAIARGMVVGPFDSGRHEWDQLRSHDSTVGRGERVTYVVDTPDTGALAVTLNLRLYF